MSVIGIDLDSTLATYTQFIAPDVIEDPDPIFVQVIQKLYHDGHHLYLWTCRATHVAEIWLHRHDLIRYFSGINVHPNTVSDSPKPSFDYYIGDEAIQWTGNNVKEILEQLEFKHSRCATDRDNDFMSAAPVPYLAGTGRGYLDMFEKHWRLAWEEHVIHKRIAFMTICSHAKPYSKSHIHGMIRRRLHMDHLLLEVDYIHISNAGIIPSGAEMTYPFNAYDHDGSQMSPVVAAYFTQSLQNRMHHWAAVYGHKYEHIVVYLRRGKTWTATENGLAALNPIMIEASASKEQYFDYAALPDADDCLISYDNLHKVSQAIRECLI